VGLRKVRFCFSAAAKVSPDVLRFFHDLGIRVKEGYGMTESTGLSFIHMGEDIKMGTVGKPISCIEFTIAEDGELLKKGPPIFVGYYKNEAATRETIIDGWLHTGDVATLDQDGHLCIVDRKKDMFISGGENVYPAEVENAIFELPQVAEAAVIGVPDDKWGEVGRAFVALKPGQRLGERELLEHLAARLAKYKIPKSVVFIEALPRNAAGKVLKNALREQSV